MKKYLLILSLALIASASQAQGKQGKTVSFKVVDTLIIDNRGQTVIVIQKNGKVKRYHYNNNTNLNIGTVRGAFIQN